MTDVALATEDELSESVGKRLLAETEGGLSPDLLFRRGGSGYLRSNMDKWCELAQQLPVVLLTDLDRAPCPTKLLKQWLGKRNQPHDFVIRIAVRETESWLLADHVAMRQLLGKKGRLPSDPDALPEPKNFLLTLAKSAARDIRDDLLAQQGAIASQGIGYNARLCAFVQNIWSPERAAQRSQSLSRARVRLRELAVRHENL